MPGYRVLSEERVMVNYYVEADSPDDAMRMVRDGDWEDFEYGDTLEIKPIDVDCMYEDGDDDR